VRRTQPLFEPATEVADRGDKIALIVTPALATTLITRLGDCRMRIPELIVSADLCDRRGT
jgi:hypothetical protein